MGEGVLMTAGYTRHGGALVCEGVPLATIAADVGTPCYVYSAATIRERYAELSGALAPLGAHIHFSAKANSSLAILGLLRSLGAGVDIVSGGELHRALLAGFHGADIVFSGVGKTREELDAALAAGVGSINVESEGELTLLQEIAAARGVVANVALRVNPNIAANTPHPYTRTGEHGMKFGIPNDRVLDVAREARESMRNVRVTGVAVHIGSQIFDPAPYRAAADVLVQLKRELDGAQLATITTIDVGGGLAVRYEDEQRPDVAAYAQALRPAADEPGVQLFVEPGRFLVAEAGVLLARVLYRKRSGGQDIVITDAGMNDLIRPSLYASHHAVESVSSDAPPSLRANVVGPVCESGDFLARDRVITDVQPGDLIVLRTAGAYGYVMASNYNSRRRPAEVLVDGDRYAVVTERERDEDLTRREALNPAWREL